MPVDHTVNILALRAHALALPAFASTSGTLEATATGYARADAGSFVTDGFREGMEVVPTGFTQTTPGIVSAVTASALTIVGGRTVQATGPGRTLTVGLPPLIAWEGVDFSPEAGRWYVDEDYVPGPAGRKTLGRFAQMEHYPTYFLNLYAPPNYGVLALYALADALTTRFAPETALVLTSGDVLRVRGDVAPFRGQLTTRAGYAVVPVTIPLILRTANSI